MQNIIIKFMHSPTQICILSLITYILEATTSKRKSSREETRFLLELGASGAAEIKRGMLLRQQGQIQWEEYDERERYVGGYYTQRQQEGR